VNYVNYFYNYVKRKKHKSTIFVNNKQNKKIMKKLILVFVLCASGLMCQTVIAQISFKVNISSQPLWGLVGYDHVEYYYLPDIDAYYYVPSHSYYYQENGRWVNRTSLPGRYKNFDLYRTRKVVINDPKPYMRHNEYKKRFASTKMRSNQIIIRDSHESKYFEIKDHPEHSKWKNNMNKNDNRNYKKTVKIIRK